MSKSAFMTHEGFARTSTAEIKTALIAWGIYLAGTCTYCLFHQAIVSSVTPDVVKTVALALREWGIWIVLTPFVFKRLTASESEDRAGSSKRLAYSASLVLLVALAVPLVIDQVTATRNAASTVAIFLPRYAATLVVVYLVWHVFLRRTQTAIENRESGVVRNPGQRFAAPLLVSKGADECLLPIEEIQYLSAAGNYIEIGARNQRYLIRATMKQIEERLAPERFVRIHRSHIVSVQEIERIKIHRSGSGTVYLRCGASLGLSKSYRAALQQHRLH
jgi:two-component system LytT family response regulator